MRISLLAHVHRTSRQALLRAMAAVFAMLLCGCALLQATPQPGTVLFQDDFSRTSSGWDRYRDATLESDYHDDAYEIAVYEPERIAWARPGLRFADVVIEVDATVTDGPENNALGLICRYQDPQNFYFFLISADGFAGIGQRIDGVEQMFNDAAMLPADSILLGRSTNHLRAECNGTRLALSINGVAAREARANSFSSGDVGLIAGTYDQPGTRVNFDNFTVRLAETLYVP